MPDYLAPPMDSAKADLLIAAHDGDVALLYIYYTRKGLVDPEQAARDLCRTRQEILAAREKLELIGLLSAAPARPQEPARELPQYPAADIARRSREDPLFLMLVGQAGKVMGHALSSNELRVLFGIYDHLGLPAEVVVELLHYCGELCRDRYGESRRPTARAIEKEAYAWADQELLTLEQAEEYIREQRSRRGRLNRLKASLGIHGRDLTAAEQRAFSSWLELGFGEEEIMTAYERTLANTGAYKLGYMNRILLNWHEKGLHSLREIEEKDGRRPRMGSAAAQEAPKPIDMEKLRRQAEEI